MHRLAAAAALVPAMSWSLICSELHAMDVFGTTEPFASEAIYFVLTDRFANGDTGNDHPLQGGPHGSWQRRLAGPNGQEAFIGYLGGDFKGIHDHGQYLRDLGMTAVWISPIVDNPDQAFTGGSPVQFGSGVGTDGGKTGYHGYWGSNFFIVDEHLESSGFTFAEFAQKMNDNHGLKIVLDIVCNHGSPSFSMPIDQPKFGELYDAQTNLVADHQNLPPNQLDPRNQPLHRFFNESGNLAQLSDLDEDNPDVLEYMVTAYLHWIDQGADAFRIDTIAWMPHTFWKSFSDRIRQAHPGFFMFGENFNFDAHTIAQHQRPENGGISMLDFPGRNAITEVFQDPGSDYGQIQHYLHVTDCTYVNPYELATFYDNHDMSRMNASDQGFIDAHHWLYTSRGIPVLYYGSEAGFMRGRAEHQGNRNFFGAANIAAAASGDIYQRLARIATIRKQSIALQRGLQENLTLQGHQASFYRVYQKDGTNQTALVLLNKSDQPANFTVDRFLSAGTWRDADSGQGVTVDPANRAIQTTVDAHGAKVLLFDGEVNDPAFASRLQLAMQIRTACGADPVEVSPDPLVAGQSATVLYRGADLNNPIALHWGVNNWNGAGIPQAEDPMSFDANEVAHRIQIQLPDDARQFDFVFHHLGNNSWDNNNGQDWHVQVVPAASNGSSTNGPGPGPAFASRFGTTAELRLTGQEFAGWDPANEEYRLTRSADFEWRASVVAPSSLVNTPYKLTLNGAWTVNWGGGASGSVTALPRGGANATVTLIPGTYDLIVREGSSVDSPVEIRWVPHDDVAWWTQTNIYQVFIEQFGGTLAALQDRLDHLDYLGVKTIWLMPIFKSMSTHGYDTTDYYRIRPEYGTTTNLAELVQAAEDRDMRVLLDLVINHAGSEHPWFSSDDDQARRDHWFVWAPDHREWNKPWGGSGGPNVTWFEDVNRDLDRDDNGNAHDDDFYYGVFSPTMPDFNYNAPLPRSEIVNEFTSVMEHWINATGVHGFRCDAARYLVENGAHADLRKDQPATHAIWKTYRRNLEAIDPEVILLAEAPTETTGQLVAYYGEGDEFHSAFHFGFPGLLVGTVRDGRRRANLLSDLFAVQSRLPSGTQDTVFLSNHDQFAGDRVASQLGGDLAKMKSAASLYLLLSGNPAIYYGEEIGMTGAGNDAALRQPMDFAAADAQRLDPDSLMNHYARLLQVRNHYDALRAGISFFARSHAGGWDCMNCEANRLGLIREYFGETIVVFHNFSPVTLAVHVDLTSNSTGLDIPVGTPVTPLMGGGTYPAVDPGNRGFYPLGEVHPLTSRVLFLGDPAGYRDATGTLLTYENAVSAP